MNAIDTLIKAHNDAAKTPYDINSARDMQMARGTFVNNIAQAAGDAGLYDVDENTGEARITGPGDTFDLNVYLGHTRHTIKAGVHIEHIEHMLVTVTREELAEAIA